jgi:hypothetical protein
MAKCRVTILTWATPPGRSEANMIEPLPHRVGKTAAMLKLEMKLADPSGTVTYLSAQALGRLDPRSSLCILPLF